VALYLYIYTAVTARLLMSVYSVAASPKLNVYKSHHSDVTLLKFSAGVPN